MAEGGNGSSSHNRGFSKIMSGFFQRNSEGTHCDSLEVVLVGEKGVGKTCLGKRFSDNTYSSTISTVGIDSWQRLLRKDNKLIKMIVWDTEGHDRPESFMPNYFRMLHSVVIVFDSTSRDSFRSLPSWLQHVRRAVEPHVHIFIAATKSDIDQGDLTFEELQEFSEKYQVCGFQTSAKTGSGVEDLFMAIVTAVQIQHCPGSRLFKLKDDNAESPCRKCCWGLGLCKFLNLKISEN